MTPSTCSWGCSPTNNRGSAVWFSRNISVYVYDYITLISHTHTGLLQCRNQNLLYSIFPVALAVGLSTGKKKKIGVGYNNKFLYNQLLIFQDGCFWAVASPTGQQPERFEAGASRHIFHAPPNPGNARATQPSWKETLSLQSNSARPRKPNSVMFLCCIHHCRPFALSQIQTIHYTSCSLHARFWNPLAAVSTDDNVTVHQGAETVVCTYMSLWQHPSGVMFACRIFQSSREAILSVTSCPVKSYAAGAKLSDAKGETERNKLRLATCYT